MEDLVCITDRLIANSSKCLKSLNLKEFKNLYKDNLKRKSKNNPSLDNFLSTKNPNFLIQTFYPEENINNENNENDENDEDDEDDSSDSYTLKNESLNISKGYSNKSNKKYSKKRGNCSLSSQTVSDKTNKSKKMKFKTNKNVAHVNKKSNKYTKYNSKKEFNNSHKFSDDYFELSSSSNNNLQRILKTYYDEKGNKFEYFEEKQQDENNKDCPIDNNSNDINQWSDSNFSNSKRKTKSNDFIINNKFKFNNRSKVKDNNKDIIEASDNKKNIKNNNNNKIGNNNNIKKGIYDLKQQISSSRNCDTKYKKLDNNSNNSSSNDSVESVDNIKWNSIATLEYDENYNCKDINKVSGKKAHYRNSLNGQSSQEYKMFMDSPKVAKDYNTFTEPPLATSKFSPFNIKANDSIQKSNEKVPQSANNCLYPCENFNNISEDNNNNINNKFNFTKNYNNFINISNNNNNINNTNNSNNTNNNNKHNNINNGNNLIKFKESKLIKESSINFEIDSSSKNYRNTPKSPRNSSPKSKKIKNANKSLTSNDNPNVILENSAEYVQHSINCSSDLNLSSSNRKYKVISSKPNTFISKDQNIQNVNSEKIVPKLPKIINIINSIINEFNNSEKKAIYSIDENGNLLELEHYLEAFEINDNKTEFLNNYAQPVAFIIEDKEEKNQNILLGLNGKEIKKNQNNEYEIVFNNNIDSNIDNDNLENVNKIFVKEYDIQNPGLKYNNYEDNEESADEEACKNNKSNNEYNNYDDENVDNDDENNNEEEENKKNETKYYKNNQEFNNNDNKQKCIEDNNNSSSKYLNYYTENNNNSENNSTKIIDYINNCSDSKSKEQGRNYKELEKLYINKGSSEDFSSEYNKDSLNTKKEINNKKIFIKSKSNDTPEYEIKPDSDNTLQTKSISDNNKISNIISINNIKDDSNSRVLLYQLDNVNRNKTCRNDKNNNMGYERFDNQINQINYENNINNINNINNNLNYNTNSPFKIGLCLNNFENNKPKNNNNNNKFKIFSNLKNKFSNKNNYHVRNTQSFQGINYNNHLKTTDKINEIKSHFIPIDNNEESDYNSVAPLKHSKNYKEYSNYNNLNNIKNELSTRNKYKDLNYNLTDNRDLGLMNKKTYLENCPLYYEQNKSYVNKNKLKINNLLSNCSKKSYTQAKNNIGNNNINNDYYKYYNTVGNDSSYYKLNNPSQINNANGKNSFFTCINAIKSSSNSNDNCFNNKHNYYNGFTIKNNKRKVRNTLDVNYFSEKIRDKVRRINVKIDDNNNNNCNSNDYNDENGYNNNNYNNNKINYNNVNNNLNNNTNNNNNCSNDNNNKLNQDKGSTSTLSTFLKQITQKPHNDYLNLLISYKNSRRKKSFYNASANYNNYVNDNDNDNDNILRSNIKNNILRSSIKSNMNRNVLYNQVLKNYNDDDNDNDNNNNNNNFISNNINKYNYNNRYNFNLINKSNRSTINKNHKNYLQNSNRNSTYFIKRNGFDLNLNVNNNSTNTISVTTNNNHHYHNILKISNNNKPLTMQDKIMTYFNPKVYKPFDFLNAQTNININNKINEGKYPNYDTNYSNGNSEYERIKISEFNENDELSDLNLNMDYSFLRKEYEHEKNMV